MKVKWLVPIFLVCFLGTAWAGLTKESAKCVSCHRDKTSFIVAEWKKSKHYENDVGCFE